MSPPKLRSRDTPLSYNGALVVQAMAQGHKYGFEIMRVTALKSGTVYPLLRRLEASGLVQSNWENKAEAFDDGRPARRYYEPTAEGPSDLAIENFLGGFAVGRQRRYVAVKNLVRFVYIEGCETRFDPDGVVDVLALLQLYLVVGKRGKRANRHGSLEEHHILVAFHLAAQLVEQWAL